MNASPRTVACFECDSLLHLPALPPGVAAHCPRCDARLSVNPHGGIDTPLALSLTALILYVIANTFPLLTLELQAAIQSVSFTQAALVLVKQHMLALGILVWITSVLAPGLVIGGTLYLLLAVRLHQAWPGQRLLLAILCRIRPWSMLDVFMLGILVAMVKLAGMADIIIGPGLYAFAPLLLCSIGIATTLEPQLLWEHLEHCRHE